MAQTAALSILEIKDLALLQQALDADAGNTKNWLKRMKKTADSFASKLESFAIEKISYRWSGFAFAVLAVFSKERLGVDWDNLEYSRIANTLQKNSEAGMYIFSINDLDLLKLKPNGLFYSVEELDQFAIEFEGNQPGNREIMKNAVEVLNLAFSKLTKQRVAVLLIE